MTATRDHGDTPRESARANYDERKEKYALVRVLTASVRTHSTDWLIAANPRPEIKEILV